MLWKNDLMLGLMKCGYGKCKIMLKMKLKMEIWIEWKRLMKFNDVWRKYEKKMMKRMWRNVVYIVGGMDKWIEEEWNKYMGL